jgi:hypothetical protein
MRAREPYQAAVPRDYPRPGTPMPPRGAFQPGYPRPSGRGQGSTSGRPPAGPGHAPSGGQRPAPPGPAGAYGTFDGGYAEVIRATDDPSRPDGRTGPPHPGQPAGPVGPAGRAPADADVFVYRDPSTPSAAPPASSPARDPAEHDTAYWYDLLTEDTALGHEEARGPFEPLQSSSGTSSGPVAAVTGSEPARTGPGQASSGDAAQARARKLEQLKDLYLTAEAIGEENVDKHFDHLLAQQRELISEYFSGSAVARPAGPQAGESGPTVASPRDGRAAEAGAVPREPRHPGRPGATGRQAGNPEGAGAAAEQPHAW